MEEGRNEGRTREGRGEERRKRREGRGGRWNELIEFKKVIKKRESYQGREEDTTSKQEIKREGNI